MAIETLIEKAERLVRENRVHLIKRYDTGAYMFRVVGETEDHIVLITNRNEPICNCDYHMNTNKLCSHIIAVILWIRENIEKVKTKPSKDK